MIGSDFIAAAKTGRGGFWRYLATLLLAFILWTGVSFAFAVLGLLTFRSGKLTDWNPIFVFVVDLMPFAFIIAGLWLGLRFLQRRPLMSIVDPSLRFNWRRFWFGAGVWVALAAAGDLVLSLLQPGNYHWSLSFAAFLPYLVLALLLVPIQASAEELLFRGYLTQSLGLVAWWLGWLLPAIIFGLMHGFNPEVGTYGILLSMPQYIGIGLLFGWVTLRSQSLEMSMGMHIANNLYATLVVTFPDSALATPALWSIQRYDPLAALLAFIISSLVFLVIFEAASRRLWYRGAPVALLLIASLLLSACSPGAALTPTRPATPAPTAATTGTPLVTPTATPTPENGLTLKDCTYEMPNSSTDYGAKCGTLEVPENRQKPEGRKIEINFVVLKATSRNPAPDPLFLLAGGPGQAATEAFFPLIRTLVRIRARHDLVLVDQRGTGKSNPMQCDQPTGAPEVITADIPLDVQLQQINACVAQIQKGHDLTQYSTRAFVDDLEAVRQALGYGKVNLLGVSYGTTAALAYLSLYPASVRALALDGVAPVGWVVGSSLRADAQRSLDLIFQRCARDAACQQKSPRLKTEFYSLLSDLRENPVEVSVPDPVSGEIQKVQITPSLLSATVRMMSYSDAQAALIPLVIHSAAQGNLDMVASQYLLSGAASESLNVGLYYSVWCYEDYPLLSKTGELGDYYFSVNLDSWKQACSRWPAVKNPTTITPPKGLDTPVLIISGDADPVTPPENGDIVARALPNVLQLDLPGMGHNNFYVGCLPNLIRDLIDSASVKGLNTDCVSTIRPMPFFLNPVGPENSPQ